MSTATACTRKKSDFSSKTMPSCGNAVRPAPEALQGGVSVTTESDPALLPVAPISGQCEAFYKVEDGEKIHTIKR